MGKELGTNGDDRLEKMQRLRDWGSYKDRLRIVGARGHDF